MGYIRGEASLANRPTCFHPGENDVVHRLVHSAPTYFLGLALQLVHPVRYTARMADSIRAVPTPPSPGRLPPQSLEAEMAVLGAVLLDNNAFSIATETITHVAFYKKAHQDIFAAMEGLSARGEAIDIVTLSEELKQRGTFHSVGAPAYLTTIMDQTHTAANVEHYANIVMEKFIMRRLITISNDIATQCYSGDREATEVLDEAERHIFEISQQGMFKGFEPIGKIIRSHFKNIEELYSSGSHISGMPSPFEDLDSLTSGFQKSDLIIIAGRPGMGKTSFALNLGQYLALKQKTPVGVFSLEMSSEQLVTRLLCSEARIDSNKLRRGYLKSNEYAELAIVAGYLAEAPIFIDDSAGLSTVELRAKARRLKAEHGVGMLIVDYLQLVSVKERTENRQQQISLISRGLKALAKELEIPVLALSQLSRAVESRGGDKRPMLSDLRESGSIEQDADVVLFLYRPEVYDSSDENRGKAELIIGKQRNGPTGTVNLTFIDSCTRFEPAAFGE